MEHFSDRRKVFINLCETRDDVEDNPFDWGTWKIFFGRAQSVEQCVKDFIQWKEVVGKRKNEDRNKKNS